MGDHDDLRTKHDHGHTPADRADPSPTAGATERSSDRVLDPGDSHDKGERSLCVGEAA
ncbi:MAG TPA: hypothetical protein VIC86_12855 [Acidimicrobiales bacterium]|jgi:hypothetical protein